MRNQTLKQLISLTLSAAMVVSLATSQGNTSSGLTVNTNTPMTGETLVVVNTDSSGFFTGGDGVTVDLGLPTVSASTQNGVISQSLQPGEPAPDNIMGYDENGNGIIDPNSFLEPVVFEPAEMQSHAPAVYSSDVPSNYKVGDTKTIKVGLTDANNPADVLFKVMAVGNYAVVWTPASGGQYTINTADAESLAAEFDKNYQTMVDTFGNPMVPGGNPDNDGKIALVCYDIGNDGAGGSGAYTAGYFNSADLTTQNRMDMLHIDSAKGMKDGVSQAFGTVMHEFQHLISHLTVGQYGYYKEVTDITGVAGNYQGINVFLNEAFSETADYLFYRDSGRIDQLKQMSSPVSLTKWNHKESLTNYSLSFLFGQYLIAQGGEEVIRELNSAIRIAQKEKLNTSNAMQALTESEILSAVATVVGADSSADLIADFYTALAVQDASGQYSIGDHNWLGDIKLLALNSANNMPAGSAFYYTNSYTDYTPPENPSLTFRSLTPAPPDYAENSAADVAGSDGMINTEDLTAVATSDNYNQSVGAGDPLDVNNDNLINFADLAIIRNSKNFGKAVNPNTN